MAKRKFNLSETELHKLQAAYHQEKDGPTRTRYQAVRMYALCYPVTEIMSLTGCARSTLMSWCHKHRQRGVAGLRDKRGGPQASKLTAEQIGALREKLLLYTPYDVLGPEAHTVSGLHWTVPDLYCAVKKWFGVVYRSRTSYLNLFAACGFS